MNRSIFFADAYGQKLAVGHLQNALRTGRISHAYILCGEKGSGRMQLAQSFAAALQCQGRQVRNGLIEPCGECSSCLQAASSNHPDIITVLPEERGKDASLHAADVRRLREDVQIKPYQGSWKIYIIPEADRMNAISQNILLKTLEEPPSYVVLLLLSESTERFLPTVLSRCITLRLQPVDAEVIATHLEENGIPQERALLCARLSHGNAGRARILAEDDQYWQLRSESIGLLGQIAGTDTCQILSFIDHLSGREVDDFLDLCESWLRDLALVRSTRQTGELIFQDEAAYFCKAAEVLSLADIQRGLEAVNLAYQRRQANGTDSQVLEMLLLSLRTALRRTKHL